MKARYYFCLKYPTHNASLQIHCNSTLCPIARALWRVLSTCNNHGNSLKDYGKSVYSTSSPRE